jgi:hypothetical protein
VTPDGEEIGPGLFSIDGFADGEDALRGKRMGAHRESGGRFDRGERERHADRVRGVREDHDVVGRTGLGVLEVELIIRVAVDPWKPEGLQLFDAGRPQTVIPASGIPDPQDEDAGRTLLLI